VLLPKVCKDQLDHQGRQVNLVHKDLRATMVRRVHWETPAPAVQKVSSETSVQVDPKDSQDRLETLVPWDRSDRKDRPEMPDLLVRREFRVPLETLDPWEFQASRDLQDSVALLATLGRLVLRDHRATRAPQVRTESQEQQDC